MPTPATKQSRIGESPRRTPKRNHGPRGHTYRIDRENSINDGGIYSNADRLDTFLENKGVSASRKAYYANDLYIPDWATRIACFLLPIPCKARNASRARRCRKDPEQLGVKGPLYGR